MCEQKQQVTWEAISPFIGHFSVWEKCPEERWFEKAWRGVVSAGLADYATEEERHRVFIRAIALGLMYLDYCELEWGEGLCAHSIVSELYWDDSLSHVRIGNMTPPLSDTDRDDDHDLFVAAVFDLLTGVRLQVYDAIVKEFLAPGLLYAGLFFSRQSGVDQDKLEERLDELPDVESDESGFPMGINAAFSYVVNGAMLAIDA